MQKFDYISADSRVRYTKALEALSVFAQEIPDLIFELERYSSSQFPDKSMPRALGLLVDPDTSPAVQATFPPLCSQHLPAAAALAPFISPSDRTCALCACAEKNNFDGVELIFSSLDPVDKSWSARQGMLSFVRTRSPKDMRIFDLLLPYIPQDKVVFNELVCRAVLRGNAEPCAFLIPYCEPWVVAKSCAKDPAALEALGQAWAQSLASETGPLPEQGGRSGKYWAGKLLYVKNYSLAQKLADVAQTKNTTPSTPRSVPKM